MEEINQKVECKVVHIGIKEYLYLKEKILEKGYKMEKMMNKIVNEYKRIIANIKYFIHTENHSGILQLNHIIKVCFFYHFFKCFFNARNRPE